VTSRLVAAFLIVFAVAQIPFSYIGLTVMVGSAQSGPHYYYLLYLGFADPEDLVGPDHIGPLPELR